MNDDAQLGAYRLLVDKKGDFVTEISGVPEESVDSLRLSDNDRLMLKAAIRVFNREIHDLHRKIEKELQTIIIT